VLDSMLTIRRLNSQHDWGPIRPLDEREIHHFDNDYDIHTGSKNYEARLGFC
jgi:hypothetical protein